MNRRYLALRFSDVNRLNSLAEPVVCLKPVVAAVNRTILPMLLWFRPPIGVFPAMFVCFYSIFWAAEVFYSFYHDRFFAMRTQCMASHLMISFIYSVVYVFLNAVCINVEFFVLTADVLRGFFFSNPV